MPNITIKFAYRLMDKFQLTVEINVTKSWKLIFCKTNPIPGSALFRSLDFKPCIIVEKPRIQYNKIR